MGKNPLHILFRPCIALLLCMVGTVMPCGAQNNPYKIDDQLYPIYQRSATADSLHKLLITDTLYREAKRLGDKKAQCVALTIPLQTFQRHKDSTNMVRSIERLKTEARANGYLQYYYYAWNQLIIFLLNKDHSLQAIQEAERMRKQAFTDNHPYGIYTCLYAQSNIFEARRNYRLAQKYRSEALEYMLKKLPEQDPALLYAQTANYYTSIAHQYEKALEYCDEGIAKSKTNESRRTCLVQKCRVFYEMGDSTSFNRYYDIIMKEEKALLRSTGHAAAAELQIKKAIIDKNYSRARRLTDSAKHNNSRTLFHDMIYRAAGDYKSAYNCLHRYMTACDSINENTQASDIAELTAQTNAQQLKLENMELSIREHQNAQHYRNTISAIISLALAGICVFLLYHQWKRRRMMEMLQRRNDELAIAIDQAQSANRMKTVFVQNMSHEIRTPLNAIVGFSQLIASDDLELEPAEKKEYSQLIEHNSELLTTLMNDLLGLAELESGKYVIYTASHPCNELCREAIAIVNHRKPQDVRLYYTSDVPDDFCLLTDGLRVRQILINFLTNAEKHTSQGEIRLHCSLNENPGSITFSVTDTGCGIPSEAAGRIFERFEKLDPFEQGTGLGLNICLLIARLLHGEVRLDTGYTGGARFLFILPLKDYGRHTGNDKPAPSEKP